MFLLENQLSSLRLHFWLFIRSIALFVLKVSLCIHRMYMKRAEAHRRELRCLYSETVLSCRVVERSRNFFLTFTDINKAFCLITGNSVIGKHFGHMHVERKRRILFLMR